MTSDVYSQFVRGIFSVASGGAELLGLKNTTPEEHHGMAVKAVALIPETHVFILSDYLTPDALGTTVDQLFLSLPFQTCFFYSPNAVIGLPGEKGSEVIKHKIDGLLVHEKSPGYFMVVSIGSGLTDNQNLISFFRHDPEHHEVPGLVSVLNLISETIRRRSCGVSRQKPEKIRIGSGKDRKKVAPKRVVYICPKKDEEKTASEAGLMIDWSHRWEVMGHWRKISGIGKGRDGVYGVTDYTWVVPHTKGPEAAPLIKKTRIVLSGDSGDQNHPSS